MNKHLEAAIKDLRVKVSDNYTVSTHVRTAGRQLWDVLTALRGPDDACVSSVVKEATTGVVRYAVLGPTFRHCREGEFIFNGAIYGWDLPVYVEVRTKMEVEVNHFNHFNHFYHHAKWAFEALGLSWDQVNPR